MSAPTNSDFNKGMDFTGEPNFVQEDLNQLVDNASPFAEIDPLEGKGLVMATKDTAIDTPSVPVTASYPDPVSKWKRYLWKRLPYAGASWTTPKVYVWADLGVSDATYLKWVEIGDTATIQAALDIAENDIETLQTNVNDLGYQLAATSTIAGDASTTANQAQATADGLSASVTAANQTASDANAAAVNALSVANAATTAAGAAKDITGGVTAANGTEGQRLEVNQATAPTALRYYSAKNKYVKITETKDKGVDAGSAVVGLNLRMLNTIDYNPALLVDLLSPFISGDVVINEAGTYRITAVTTHYNGEGAFRVQAYIQDENNNVLLTGTSLNDSFERKPTVSGILTLAVGAIIRLNMYCSHAYGAFGLGRAANVHPNATGKEVYSVLELEKLD